MTPEPQDLVRYVRPDGRFTQEGMLLLLAYQRAIAALEKRVEALEAP